MSENTITNKVLGKVLRLRPNPVHEIIDDLNKGKDTYETITVIASDKDGFIIFCNPQDIATLLGTLRILEDELLDISRQWEE